MLYLQTEAIVENTTQDLIASTRNPTKLLQFRPFFDGLPVRLCSLHEEGIEGEAIEDGVTLQENAEKKAVFAFERSKKASFADDTGLFIDALDGAPGIHAARWAGNGKTTEEIMRFTLDKLSGIPLPNRTALFKTVVVYVDTRGVRHLFSGEARGILLEEPRVDPQSKMPYSGIFLPDGATKVWAEMTTQEENAISHRGRAFSHLRNFLSKTLC